MLTFHNYISLVTGMGLIVYSILLIFIPPVFGNILYGVSTKLTLKNKNAWNEGQKLFALAIFIIGVILSFLGFFKIDDHLSPYSMFALILIMWALAKIIVHIILAKNHTS